MIDFVELDTSFFGKLLFAEVSRDTIYWGTLILYLTSYSF